VACVCAWFIASVSIDAVGAQERVSPASALQNAGTGDRIEAERPVAGRPPGWVPSAATGVEVASADGLDWQQAVRTAVLRYPAIAGARAAIEQQVSLVSAARAGYLPRVQAEVTSGQQGEFGTGQVATVGLSQMLYDFGKTRSAVQRERAAERRERAELLLAIDEVIEQATHALIEIHRHQALEETYVAQIEALSRVEEITRLRAEAGAATRSDPLQARTRVEAVEAKLSAARSQIRQWRSRLEIYIGEDAARPLTQGPGRLLEWPALEVDVDRLPVMLAAQAQRGEAEAAMRQARAQRYPTISLEASANHRLGDAGERHQQLYGRRTYSNALVAVRSDLYQGGAVAAQARASASALEVADEMLRAERLLALDALRGHRERIAGLVDRVGLLERRATSIVETRALYWDQYLELGTRNVLDLLNAEQEIGQSAEDLETARHDLWRARLDYLLASGTARAAFDVDVPGDDAGHDPIGVTP